MAPFMAEISPPPAGSESANELLKAAATMIFGG